jgi:hypothetical protein
MTIASFAEVNENAPGTAAHQKAAHLEPLTILSHMANELANLAAQLAPIGELRKDFDRLRTVLFKRLRTQSSNFNYTGKRKPEVGAQQACWKAQNRLATVRKDV